MIPRNEKSLFHLLCDAMDQVMSGEIDPTQATAVSKLAGQTDKLLKGERDRVRLLMAMDKHEREFGKRPVLRELAGVGFADTTIDQKTGNPRYDDGVYMK